METSQIAKPITCVIIIMQKSVTGSNEIQNKLEIMSDKSIVRTIINDYHSSISIISFEQYEKIFGSDTPEADIINQTFNHLEQMENTKNKL